MDFGDKLKAGRQERNWSQEELAEKLFVSRQSVSKWENGQNYPSIETIIKISDLFELTIDELLRSDQALTQKVIRDSKRLAYPRFKFLCDMVFLVGVAILVLKLGILLVNKVASLEIALPGGSFLWNFGPLILMVAGGIGSGTVKEKFIDD